MAIQSDPRRLGSASQINQYRAVRPDHVDSSTATPNGGSVRVLRVPVRRDHHGTPNRP